MNKERTKGELNKNTKNDETMNKKNLRTLTTSEAREIGRKGGIASGKARLRKKHGEELVRTILAMKEPDPKIIAALEAYGIDPKDITREVAMHARQIERAIKSGDTPAYRAVNEASGYLVRREESAMDQRMIIVVENEEQKRKLENIGELDI